MDRRGVITIFGGSAVREGETGWDEAYQLGRMIAMAGFILCNGGFGGTMEASSQGAKEAGGKTIGVITSFLDADRPNPWVDEVIYVGTYLERIQKLIEIGDGFIVLKGSVGTFSEFFLLWCLEYIGKIPRKPIVLLGEAWRKTIRTLEKQMQLTPLHLNLLSFASSPQEAVEIIIENLYEGSR
ncbi:TPA: LOG family protein [Candidatus Poribacteria bacterium]|nr:LOG family protein [Candidatus Poribacteria bacterium]